MDFIPTQTFYGRRWRPAPVQRYIPQPQPPAPLRRRRGPSQLQQLVAALGALALQPKQKQKRAQKKPKKTPLPKPKKTQKPKKPTQKKKSKPGKRMRNCMKIENDCIFPVMLDGKVNGYACLVGDKVMKPAHVKGTIDNPELAKLTFKKSSKYDLECAQVPVCMKSDASKFTHEKPEGHYNWHHGAVQFSNGRFTIPTGSGKPGDSGRPIFDNTGKVVAIVLGGANEGARTALSVVTWNKDMVTRITPEESVEWSAAALNITALCVLQNLSFPCDAPPCAPCCYEKDPAGTLRLLSDHYYHPKYYDLLDSMMHCPQGRRPKRSVAHFEAYKATRPYIGWCADCGLAGSCPSPVSIEHVWSDADDGVLKIQVSMQIGIAKSNTINHAKIRYMGANGVQEAERSTLSVSTTAPCDILATMGHFILARCRPGSQVEVSLSTDPKLLCRTPFSHKPRFIGNEKSPAPTGHKTRIPCKTYSHQTDLTREEITMHVPPDVPIQGLVSNTGKSYSLDPKTKTIKYKCTCGETVKEGTATNKITLFNCDTAPKCITYAVDNTVWQYNSQYVPRSEVTEVKGKIHVPFPLTDSTCAVSVAPEPQVTYRLGEVEFHFHPMYPTLFSIRSLGKDPNHSQEWIDTPMSKTIQVGAEGVEYVWGNNNPVRLWAQKSSSSSAHGNPISIVSHYYDLYPYWTITVLASLGLLIVISSGLSCFLCSVARTKCLTPYQLAPGAQLPTFIALLCCAKSARADTLDDFSYLWTNNQAMFWLQLASPVAAFLCLSYCCRNLACCMKIFLGISGLCVIATQAYEHSTTMPNQVGIPFKALIERPGYAALPLSLVVIKSELVPSLVQDYITCNYKTVVPSPYIKCCGGAECSHKNEADYKCSVFTGVYPFMWGGAYCFCDTENSQMSEVYVTRGESCEADHAIAYQVHTASLKAQVMISIGELNQTVDVFVNGDSPARIQQSKFILGPISSAWTPFDHKVIVYRDEVYNEDYAPYGSGQAGRFGDIQSRTVNSTDVYANTNLKLKRPASGNVHVPYTQTPSGFSYWKKEKGVPLNRNAPFGCVIKVNPVRAENCVYGNIPISMDIADAHFTRIDESPSVSLKACEVQSCTYSSDFGGVASISYTSNKVGKCAIHSHSNSATMKDSVQDVQESGALSLFFATSSVEPNFVVQVCNARITCHGKCEPPKDHIVPYAAKHNDAEFPSISTTAWQWLAHTTSGPLTILVVAIIVVVVVSIVVCARH
nr:structural polyprotein [Barmah Forest virus]